MLTEVLAHEAGETLGINERADSPLPTKYPKLKWPSSTHFSGVYVAFEPWLPNGVPVSQQHANDTYIQHNDYSVVPESRMCEQDDDA